MVINTISEAKAQLSALVERVLQGEEVIIARAGKPVAVLKAFQGHDRPRKPGSMKGKIRVAPDFDDLPADIGDAFGVTKE